MSPIAIACPECGQANPDIEFELCTDCLVLGFDVHDLEAEQ